MQNFKTLRQSLLGELAMSPEEREREKNAIYSGHLRFCQQPRAAHALRSDQFSEEMKKVIYYEGELPKKESRAKLDWGDFNELSLIWG